MGWQGMEAARPLVFFIALRDQRYALGLRAVQRALGAAAIAPGFEAGNPSRTGGFRRAMTDA